MSTSPLTREETCSLEKARGCLGLMCAHHECFLKPFFFHRQHSLFCLLLCHSYCRFHPVLLDSAKGRKHHPCSTDLTDLQKSRYWSLLDGKEKQDSHYPGAPRCFGKTAAWQLQSPHALHIDRCWSAVRLLPVWSCMFGKRSYLQS